MCLYVVCYFNAHRTTHQSNIGVSLRKGLVLSVVRVSFSPKSRGDEDFKNHMGFVGGMNIMSQENHF